MSTYTKSPWEIDWYKCKTDNEVHWRVPTSIGPISGPYIGVEEADAYLIAAAPDLLEALEAMIADLKLRAEIDSQGYRVLDISAGVLRRAEKAIAKAKGEV